MRHAFAILIALMSGCAALANPGFQPAGPELSSVTIVPANLHFSAVAQNIAPIRFDAEHGFERSLANPTLTQLDVNGAPFVYLLMRVERETDRGTRLILARIPADQFSDGTNVTPFPKWQAIPDSRFSITPPKGSKGVLNAAMTAHDGKILITYQARSVTKNGDDNLGFMTMFDPVTQKTLWTKPIQTIPGYAGTQKPTGLTRVTADPVSPAGDYFDSTKGRLVLGYMCRQDVAPACTDNGAPWDGFVLQELTISGTGNPQFLTPVRMLREEVPDGTSVKAWAAQGETVWKKQSFNFGNGGADTLIFSVNFNLVTENTPARPTARDFPSHSAFFAVNAVSALLDAAKSGPIDLSAKAPPSRTWQPDLSTDSPWDQGAVWNSMFYIDPYHANAKFVLYESWGANYMQPPQTRNALYGGSSSRTVKSGSAEFSQSCDAVCGGGNVAGGGARKPYCLSVSAPDGTEVSHDRALGQVVDSVTGQSLASASLVCSDIGTSKTQPDNLIIASDTVGKDQPALTFAEAVCAAKGASGVIWMDALAAGKAQINLSDTATLHQGDALTVACSTQFPSAAFRRDVQVSASGPSCDMACDALGPGDGTGFRAYRSRLSNANGTDQSSPATPFTSLDLLAQPGVAAGKAAVPQRSTRLECSCGPGREMRGIASARVAP